MLIMSLQMQNYIASMPFVWDNEAVVKMIFEGRSQTMSHVSRTHRVALDWLFDRINFDPKIQIRYVDTKTELADIKTKGSFTRDEWNHLLCLFNVVNNSMFSCGCFSQLTTSPSISNNAEFEFISKPGESHRKLFNFGFAECRATVCDGFE